MQENHISELLSPLEQKEIRDIARAQAHNILYVADADLRHQTENDWRYIHELHDMTDGESAWNDKTNFTIQQLEAIIGSGSHSMLGKVYASFEAVDLIYKAGGGLHSKDFSTFLLEAISTAPTEQESMLLTAAFYSRFMAWVVTHYPNGVEKLGEYHTKLLGIIDSPLAARRQIYVAAAAEVFASEIREDEFGMRLPEAYIATDTTDNRVPYEKEGFLIPQAVMYLPPDHYASYQKLVEAVQLGIPGLTPEQRIPQLLVGVEIPIGQQTKERIRLKLGYVAMRALRKPKDRRRLNWELSLTHENGEAFSDENLLRYCSFDTLSLIAAIRISRELTAENTPSGFSVSNIVRKVNSYIRFEGENKGRYLKEYQTAFGRQDSILSVALRESQQIDGEPDWDIVRAANHLRSQIIGLIISDVRGHMVRWRNESDISKLYQTHVLIDELSAEDKLQMAAFLLQDPKHKFWNKLSRLSIDQQQHIVGWLHHNVELDNAIAQLLIGHVPDFLTYHCETIRDEHIPVPPQVHPFSSENEDNS